MNFGKDYPEEIVSKFFVERFGRRPQDDPSYYQEWKTRIMYSGNPEAQMDSRSLNVWRRYK